MQPNQTKPLITTLKTKQTNNLTLPFFTNVAYVNLFQLLLAVASVRANAVKKSKSDAHAFTIGQIYQGLPVNTAYVASHPRNIRVITGVDHGHGHIAGYGAISNIGNAGFGHHGYASYGKRNAYSGQFSRIWGIENSRRAQHRHRSNAQNGVRGHYEKRDADAFNLETLDDLYTILTLLDSLTMLDNE